MSWQKANRSSDLQAIASLVLYSGVTQMQILRRGIMNPAMLALSAANPGLLPLAFAKGGYFPTAPGYVPSPAEIRYENESIIVALSVLAVMLGFIALLPTLSRVL
jgi:hypothetical protein